MSVLEEELDESEEDEDDDMPPPPSASLQPSVHTHNTIHLLFNIYIIIVMGFEQTARDPQSTSMWYILLTNVCGKAHV